MTNKEIFFKVYSKAEKNFYEYKTSSILPSFLSDEDLYNSVENGTYFRVIFSHEFAKAFWGERVESELISVPGISKLIRGHISWQLHLSKMVLEKEPLKYLEKFLKD